MVEKKIRRAENGSDKLLRKYGIDMEVERRIRGILLRGKGKVTPGAPPTKALECIRNAVAFGTFERLKTGIWFCCYKNEENDSLSWRLCFMFRVVSGPAKPASRLYAYMLDAMDTFGYAVANEGLDGIVDANRAPEVMAVLPPNIRRTFQQHPKGRLFIPHILCVTVERKCIFRYE